MKRFFEGVRARRAAISLAFAGALVLGAWTALRMPASIMPEVTFPRITVIADAGELPAAVMMRSVTLPIESAIRSLPHVLEVRSTSSRGSAEINVDCEWNSNMDLTLQRVQTRIEAVRPQLPPGTSLDARLLNPTLFPVIGYSITSDQISLPELRDLAEFTIKPELARLPGVAEVVVQGGHQLEARISLDPARLRSRGLDAERVANAVREHTTLASVGLFESNARLYLGLADGRPHDLEDLKAIPIPAGSGPPVLLGEVADVTLEQAPEFVRHRARSRDAVLINLMRQPSASAITLSDAASHWWRDNRRRLPAGLQIQPFYDQSELVRGSMGGVRDSLVFGALLAIFVIVLFLRSLKLGLAGAVILPGSIALTLLGLSAAGQSLNMMTLGGIAAAVGLVLDDAIVVVEHLAHRAEMPGATPSGAMAELLPTLTGSTLCTLAIFVPFLMLGGVTGAFFRVLALAMALMLTASYLLCITVIPLLSRPRASARERDRVRRSTGLLEFAARRGWVGAAAILLLLGASVMLQRSLGSGFLPEMDEGALILDFISPAGSSLEETDRILQQVEQQIDATPEIEAWSRRTGDQLGFFITEPNVGDYVLKLKPVRRRSAEVIADDLRRRIESTQPALKIEFGQLVEDVIGDLTTNPQPIEVRVYCEDRGIGQATAQAIAAAIGRVRGVVDVKDGVVVSGPNVSIVPSRSAARLGLSTADLAARITPAVAGTAAGEVVRGARAWPVRIVLPGLHGLDPTDALGGLSIPLPAGGAVPLRDVAAMRIEPGETEIARDNLRSMVSVTARLSGRDLGSAMAEIQRRLAREVVLPSQVRLAYAGLWAEQQSSFRGLLGVMAGATALVLLILLFAFRSWAQALALLGVVLASLAGVFAALRVSGATFNISSFVGAIMVVGIVAENGFFLIASHRQFRRDGLPPEEAAASAARRRTRPVLMTTCAGVAALAPLSIGLGSGSELLRPLAIAVIGGFTVSAVLLLVALPSLLGRTTSGGGD